MLKKLYVLALTLFLFTQISAVNWAQQRPAATTQSPPLFTQTSIEKGWQAATDRQQPMLVMFTSDNCLYCKKMLAETYGHPGIQQMLANNTQTVLAHAGDYQALVKKLGVRGYPSSVLVAPNGEVLEFMQGYVPAKDFAQRISPILQSQARAAQRPKRTAGR
jgi:thioredoxin-related protein